MKIPHLMSALACCGIVGCTVHDATFKPASNCGKMFSNALVKSGKILIDHGDYLIFKEEASEDTQKLFLIRDERYQTLVDQLDGTYVSLALEPVSACDAAAGSSKMACIYLGQSGTAYKILEWCEGPD